jgi:hypothetical protein
VIAPAAAACTPTDPPACEAPDAAAPKVVPVLVEAEAIAPALRIAPTPEVEKCNGSYPPATLGEPCLPCDPCGCCSPCPSDGASQPAAASLSFQPAREPEWLPDLAPGADLGHMLPAPEATKCRRSFVDLTAAPCFGHASDYSWVSGQIEYSGIRKEWRLRYSSVDETDRFGGRLALIENDHLAYLADGQYVRVQGHLVNPADAESSRASYRIEAFQRIDKPNRTALPNVN